MKLKLSVKSNSGIDVSQKKQKPFAELPDMRRAHKQDENMTTGMTRGCSD